MSSIELKLGGKPHLYVASTNGDKLFQPKDDEDAMTDVTASTKLDTRSGQFAWADMNRDGLPDLVSWDGATIAVRLLRSDGTFAPAQLGWTLKLSGECLGLAPISISGDGAPAILVSTPDVPFLIDEGGKRIDLPDGAAAQDAGPGAATCIVADLDNDGFPDILQPRERGGVLWRGSPNGLERPVATPVRGEAGSRFALGDFNTDGFLDIFLSDKAHNELWENDGQGRFQPVIALAGSVGYKTPPGVSWCAATDLNHDGRPDLALAYADAGFIYHFNRGYRCLGEEGELRLISPTLAGAQAETGVAACAIADFNGDAGLDLAVALAGGELFCYYNELCDMPNVALRLKKGATGPVTVSAWQGQEHPFCIATVVVGGHSPAAFAGLRRPGECVVRYRLPGKASQSRKLTVGEATLELVLGQ
jgi:hypothetical protein